MKDYIIDQVSWHTSRTKRKVFHESAYIHMKTIVSFLQTRGLLRRHLLQEGQEIDESFCFRKSDLTDEGSRFIQKYYDKWLKSHDHGCEPNDTRKLEKWLEKMRMKSN